MSSCSEDDEDQLSDYGEEVNKESQITTADSNANKNKTVQQCLFDQEEECESSEDESDPSSSRHSNDEEVGEFMLKRDPAVVGFEVKTKLMLQLEKMANNEGEDSDDAIDNSFADNASEFEDETSSDDDEEEQEDNEEYDEEEMSPDSPVKRHK